ncbi:MFS general substrate transporter [Setomelanomma holmii]|uniref:MFS general substrate transporter n=1 Tax=Setomelanomma holmii TaxID=210430 RepID=A0A9P4H7X3_9PLEO|nr:MFS general substrate transporter [Setomelanomma holmii]
MWSLEERCVVDHAAQSDVSDTFDLEQDAAALRARRKVDTTMLPLLFLGLLVFQLDRMNFASALTDGFAKNIRLNQDTINLGNQLMFLGIVVLEIPSNMILQRIGPRKWILAQVFIFGLVAVLQVFVKKRTDFLRELAKRVAVFFFGMFGGNAISPLLASGILKLGGRGGLKVEGAFTMCVAITLLFLLPGSPDQPRPLLSPGLIRFRDTDREALQQRLQVDDLDRKPGSQGLHIPPSLVWKTVKHYRRWAHFVSTFAVFSTWSSLTTYTPTIIMALGFNRVEANALASVGGFIALGVVFLFGWLSDKANKRGLAVIIAHVCYLLVLIIARSVHPSLNCKAGERSISIAMWMMSAISGLMVGTQYYRADDIPFYSKGLRIQIIMVAIGMSFATVQEAVYIVHNRRVLRRWEQTGGEKPWLYTP